MCIENELSSSRVVKHLWALKHPTVSEMFGICKLEHLIPKRPMGKIPRGITGDIALIWGVTGCSIFTKPVERIAKMEDTAAVRLHHFATIIEPDFARANGALLAPCCR